MFEVELGVGVGVVVWVFGFMSKPAAEMVATVMTMSIMDTMIMRVFEEEGRGVGSFGSSFWAFSGFIMLTT